MCEYSIFNVMYFMFEMYVFSYFKCFLFVNKISFYCCQEVNKLAHLSKHNVYSLVLWCLYSWTQPVPEKQAHDRQTDGRTDRHRRTDGQTDRHRRTDRQTDTDGQTDRHRRTDGQTHRRTDKTDRHRQTQTDGRTQTDGWTDRQTDLFCVRLVCCSGMPYIKVLALETNQTAMP